MSDAVLIYPKTGYDYGAGITPPFSVLAAAAPAREAGYNIRVIDQRIEPKWKEELESESGRQIRLLESNSAIHAKQNGGARVQYGTRNAKGLNRKKSVRSKA